MRVSIFLVLLLANSCGTPGLDRPGDHGSTSSTGSSSTGDKRPALCADIKDDTKTKCTATAAKEGNCFYVNYKGQESCVSQKNKREFMKDKTCEGIVTEAQCHGSVVGPMEDPKVCRKKFNGCEDAPAYYNYAPYCIGATVVDIQTAIDKMCYTIPTDNCEGDEAAFSVFRSLKLTLCKYPIGKGNKCVKNQTEINNNQAKKLVDDFCRYGVSQGDREYFADKTNSGLIFGYHKDTCLKQVFGAIKPIVKTFGERGTRALLSEICVPDPSN